MPGAMLGLLAALTVLLAALLAPAGYAHAEVPEGATWTEATIEVGDGTRLHADILRPEHLPGDARTPVILSVGPYFNHSGQVGPLGPVSDAEYDPVGPSEGPSDRFHDLVEGGKLMKRGYTFVMVDLRGFGGSNGCLDWAGPGEQADVVAAVKWAASQEWSTGRVGMYGKSYDAVTGLIGVVRQPKGLAAVVAQEPVYDMYRYLYANGVRYLNSVATPALYDAIAVTPGPLADSPGYNLGGATDPACLATNYASQQNRDRNADYWRQRNLIAGAAGSDVPLFLTQGFLEDNTKPDGAWDFFNATSGPNRAWFGMWDHVRGNDRGDDGRLAMGRAGFLDEVMRFFDRHVRGVSPADAPTHEDPRIAVQGSDGSWREERSWPPADADGLAVPLRTGTYEDDGTNNGSPSRGTGSGLGTEYGNGLWTISPPLPHDAHLAGVPRAELQLATAAPNSNVVVDVYAISPDHRALLLTREAFLVPPSGKVTLDLYGNDWRIPAGHRIGVLVTGANSEWWMHVPTFTTARVEEGTVTLPFLRHTRTEKIAGDPAIRLEEWLEEAPFELSQATVDEGTVAAFPLPPAMTPRPAQPATGEPRPGRRVRARIARHGRRVIVYGDAPASARLLVRLRRAGRVVARRRTTTRINAFRVAFRVRRAGRYRALVTGRAPDGRRLRARTRAVRVPVRRHRTGDPARAGRSPLRRHEGGAATRR